jgi:hypothetical protein
MYTYADPDVVKFTDEERARAQKLADRGQQIIAREEVNGVILDTWRRGVEHGIKSNISGKTVDACLAESKANIAELQGITGEMRRMLPPDVQAELREEDAQWERKRADDAETKRIVAETMRKMAQYATLLTDVYVDSRYRRVAQHAAKWAVRQLNPGGPVPHIQFFFKSADDKHDGFYRPSQPDRIHIADHLDDYQLVACVVHEVGHAVNGPYAGDDEHEVQRMEASLTPRYLKEHGRTEYGEWRSCA